MKPTSTMMRPGSRSGKAPKPTNETVKASTAARTAKKGPDLAHERKLWRDGHQIVAGMDEVGKGAWAGPLTVGVAVINQGVRKFPLGLRDSKQIPEAVRESLFVPVGKWCAAWAVGHSSPLECDMLGMTRALRLAARRAFASLPPDAFPDALVLDGSFDFLSPRPAMQTQFEFDEPDDPFECSILGRFTRADLNDVQMPDGRYPKVKTVIKGDDACASVAAASVLAKVSRDRLMREDAPSYPGFDFESNKGYPSPMHKCALRGYGMTAIHRRTWAFADWLPVRREWAPLTESVGEEDLASSRTEEATS